MINDTLFIILILFCSILIAAIISGIVAFITVKLVDRFYDPKNDVHTKYYVFTGEQLEKYVDNAWSKRCYE